MTGLAIDESGFEVLAGNDRIGTRRSITPADATLLNDLAARYVGAVQAGAGAAVFTRLGRELFTWLDGDQKQLGQLLDQAPRPLIFEVRGRQSPSEAAWAVLRAPCDAVSYLRSGPAAQAAQLGQEAIGQLDRHRQPVPLQLLREAADAALTSGDGQTGQILRSRAVQQAQSVGTEPTSSLDQARAIAEQADYLVTCGDLDQAEQLYRHAHSLFADAGSEGEAVAVMGSIADIAYLRGGYEEALRVRREVELPAFERLGDARSVAVTWGKIADKASLAAAETIGNVDLARRMRALLDEHGRNGN